MWESRTCYHNVSSRGEVDQPESVIGGGVVQAMFSNGSTKDVLLAQLGIKITKDDFNVIARASLVCLVEELIELIFGVVIFVFGGGVSADKADVAKFSLDADRREALIHTVETQHSSSESSPNYKSTSKKTLLLFPVAVAVVDIAIFHFAYARTIPSHFLDGGDICFVAG